MNDKLGPELENTDLGVECSSLMQLWICGKYSGRCLSLLVQERLMLSARMRDNREESHDILDLLSGNMASIAYDCISIYEGFFESGPEVLFLKAKSVLVGSGVFSGISNISIPQVNITFRRLSLEARWANTVSDPPSGAIDLRHLHIYMEIIRAYMQLYKSPGRSPLNTPAPSFSASVIQNECVTPPTCSDPSKEDFASIQSINLAVDEYLIKLMKLKTRSLKILSVHKRDSLYAFLGVSPEVSDAVLKRAYRLKAMELHPDKGGTKEMFQQLNEVYETILEERGVSGSGGSTTPEDHQADVPLHETRPVPSTTRSTDSRSVKVVLKAASKCVVGAKKVTETASKIMEDPNSATIAEFVTHVRNVGYACLDVSCGLEEESRSAVSVEAFGILNAASVIVDSPISTELIQLIGDTTRKCVVCAQLVSRMAQVQESTNSTSKAAPPTSRQHERLEMAKRQRVENAQLLRKLDQELGEQHHLLIGMINPDDIDHSLIEWYKLTVCDHVNDCLVEIKDLVRTAGNAVHVVDEFVKRCQLFDQLCVPVTSIGRACRLVYITNPSFIKKRVFDQIITGFGKLGVVERFHTSDVERLHATLLSALGRIESLNISTSSSRRRSTRSSPIVRPIEIAASEQFHDSDKNRI